MPARKILIVDDDDALRESLVEQLTLHEEFETDQAATGAEAMQQARAGRVDLVVMDVGLPDMDRREAVKLLRKGGFKAPVIMLTGQDSESDTILGLEAGANDYVTKPFRFAVLLARIRASSASMSRARTPSSRSAITPSGRAPRCSSTRVARRSG
jgi:DNA-binding response OmpR family regulator